VPEDWILLEEPNLNDAMRTFAINLFKRGRLIFQRANPSGLQENAMTWSQPVIFPPK